MQRYAWRRRLTPRVALVAAAFGAAAVVIPLALPAHAATAPVAISNWYYDDPGMSASAATSQSTPSGVPMADLGVGYQNGTTSPVSIPATLPKDEPDKITGLVFDLGTVGTGSTVSSFTFSLPVDMNDAPSEAQVTGNAPMLAACLSERAIQPGSGSGPSPYEKVPSYDCGTKATGHYNAATGSYDFTATNIAQAWAADQNNGLVIVPDPATANPTTFTLSLLPATKITASITGTPAPASPPAEAAAAAPAGTQAPTTSASSPAAAAPVSSAVATRVAPVSGGGTAPVAVAPAPVSAPAPAAALPAPVGETAPEAAVPAPAVAAAAPAAAPDGDAGVAPAGAPAAVTPVRSVAANKPITVSSGIGAVGYVLLVLVIIGILAATSLGLAHPAEATGAQTSRLSKLLAGTHS